jgi:hypothetical protein
VMEFFLFALVGVVVVIAIAEIFLSGKNRD